MYFFYVKYNIFCNRTWKSLIFHVKYNISGRPTLRFPYYRQRRPYNLPTFRNAGLPISLLSAMPALRFPKFAYFSLHWFDDFPTFRHAGSPISLLSSTPARQFPYFLQRRLYEIHTCQPCWKGPNWHRACQRQKMPGSTNPIREKGNSAWLLFLAAAHAAIKQCPHVSPVLHSSNHWHKHHV